MQLESAKVSSMTVICRLASAPLPWVQWLSGKIRFPVGLIPVDISFSLSKAYIKLFLPT